MSKAKQIVKSIQEEFTKQDLEESMRRMERQGYVLSAVVTGRRRGAYLIYRLEGT